MSSEVSPQAAHADIMARMRSLHTTATFIAHALTNKRVATDVAVYEGCGGRGRHVVYQGLIGRGWRMDGYPSELVVIGDSHSPHLRCASGLSLLTDGCLAYFQDGHQRPNATIVRDPILRRPCVINFGSTDLAREQQFSGVYFGTRPYRDALEADHYNHGLTLLEKITLADRVHHDPVHSSAETHYGLDPNTLSHEDNERFVNTAAYHSLLSNFATRQNIVLPASL